MGFRAAIALKKIAALADWRGPALAQLRQWIRAADPAIAEEVKWVKPTNPAGVPVWSCGGILCTGEVYKDKLKLTFAEGAALPDPAGLFNASLDAGALQALVRAAVAHNAAQNAARAAAKKKR